MSVDHNAIALEEKGSRHLIAENAALKKKVDQVLKVALAFGVASLIALGAIIAVLINSAIANETREVDNTPICGVAVEGKNDNTIRLGQPSSPGIFHDVTADEIMRVRRFLEVNINLTKPDSGGLQDARIYTMELEPPTKTEALNYLDNDGAKPNRYARVVIFRGDKVPPIVEEQVCGPLHKVDSCRVDLTAPFNYRPTEGLEYDAYEEKLIPEIQQQLGDILRESFNGSFDYENCGDYCLNHWGTPIGSNIYGNADKRMMWILFTYDVPYISLYPLDMFIMADVSGVNASLFTIEKVWYTGKLYDSVKELVDGYKVDTIAKTAIKYPMGNATEFSSLNRRGNPKPVQNLRPPVTTEPDGKRYSILHRHITYLDMWSFDFLMQPIRGPALFDVKFLGQRIVYELSLMEMTSLYSGFSPQVRQQFFVDTSFLQGSRSKALIPGADCPAGATFLPVTLTSQGKESPAVFPNAVCVFEKSSGEPLRRHHGYSQDEGAFYGGMLDSALVLRTILVVDNYDYVVDFTFHQNGALKVSVALAGYLATNFWNNQEAPWGMKIHDYIFGPMNFHASNFKVDIDILDGSSNRYESISIVEDTQTVTGSSNQISITKMVRSVKQTETEAAYKYNFDTPTYHIFRDNSAKNKNNVERGYRLLSKSNGKQLVKQGVGNEPAISWARYQMAVTKFKESEKWSATPYGQWDSLNPIVNFQQFIDDDDSIVDQDLVAWVSMGSHIIPHSENLPTVNTVGQKSEFYLTPFNYFDEDVSMMSRDSVFLKLKDFENPHYGLTVDTGSQGSALGGDMKGKCLLKPYDTAAKWRRYPDDIFEAFANKDVL